VRGMAGVLTAPFIGPEEVGAGARPAASVISMAANLEGEVGVTRERNQRGGTGVARLGRQWGGSEQFRAACAVWWPSVGLAAAALAMTGGRGRRGRVGRARLAGRFQKTNEKKVETGWATRGFWAKIRSGRLRKIKIVFDFLIQGNGIQIKRFKYFQTEFEVDSK
jgi:hypothetical protein